MTQPADGWINPPQHLTIRTDDVHIWRASLDLVQDRLLLLADTLSEDESDRAARFHFKRDRNHFIAARGALRDILSRYLVIEPFAIRFQYSPYGKPEIADELNSKGIRFNVSHSHGVGLFAVTLEKIIGIDIEYIRDDLANEQIARRFFSTREVDSLLSLPESQQKEAFFICWTRKEAYIKAIGEGLSMPLDSFDVTLIPGEPASLLSTRTDPHAAATWTLRGFYPKRGYIAALAVQAQKLHPQYWNWSGKISSQQNFSDDTVLDA